MRAASSWTSGSSASTSAAASSRMEWPSQASVRSWRSAELAVQARQAAGQRGKEIGLAVAEGHLLKQLLEGDRGLLLEADGIGQVLVADANRVDDHEARLGARVGRHGLKVGAADDPHAS